MPTDDKELVQKSWQQLKSITKLDDVGMSLFVTLFSKYPEVKPLFKFLNEVEKEDELRSNSQLLKHAQGVVNTLDTAVAMLDDLEKLSDILCKLGAKHKHYGARRIHFAAVGTALLITLEEFLGPDFTNDTKQAWSNVYDVVKTAMGTKMIE